MIDFARLFAFGHAFVRDDVLWIQVDAYSNELISAVKGEDDLPATMHLLRAPTPEEYQAGSSHPLVAKRLKEIEAEPIPDPPPSPRTSRYG